MKWSLRIARVSGIDIKVHASFLLVVLYFALVFGSPHGLVGAAFGTAVVITLFGCVVLHELGHSLVAQRLGVSVREIILLPIGGLARLGREPSKPLHELVIAIAGPLVNVVIAVLLTGLALALYGPSGLFSDRFLQAALGPPSVEGLVSSLLAANVMLAVFNMIPALPMDGGRVFRALLAMMVGKPKATRVAAAVGQVLAGGLAVYAIVETQLILALIAGFVFLGASQERLSSQVTEAVRGLQAGEVCDPNAITLMPGDMVGTAVDHLLRTPQAHFAVVHGEQLVGTLSRDEVLAAAGAVGLGAFVAGVMRRDIAQVDAATPLDELRSTLMELAGRPVAVFGPQGFIGLLGYEDVSRIAALASALERHGIVRPAVARPDVPTVAAPSRSPRSLRSRVPRWSGLQTASTGWARKGFTINDERTAASRPVRPSLEGLPNCCLPRPRTSDGAGRRGHASCCACRWRMRDGPTSLFARWDGYWHGLVLVSVHPNRSYCARGRATRESDASARSARLKPAPARPSLFSTRTKSTSTSTRRSVEPGHCVASSAVS